MQEFFMNVLDIVFPARDTQILVRALSREGIRAFKPFLKPRIVTIEGIPIATLFSYAATSMQACILEAKFHKNRKAQQLLGTVLSIYIKVSAGQCSSRLPENLTFVPLPLGNKRRKERGYNQIEEIGRFMMKNLEKDQEMLKNCSIQLSPGTLRRIRNTLSQTTLGREARKSNMHDAFTAPFPLDPETTYILLDDVVTTGATLLAAREALEKAGATRILLLALAH